MGTSSRVQILAGRRSSHRWTELPNIARRTGPWSTLEVARGVDLLRETELRFGVWREVESLVCATKEHRLGRGVFMS